MSLFWKNQDGFRRPLSRRDISKTVIFRCENWLQKFVSGVVASIFDQISQMRYWMKAPNKCFQMNPKLCQGTIVTRRYFTFKVFQLLAALTLTARISAPPPSSGSNQVWPSTATLLPPGCLSSDVCLSQQPAVKILKLSDGQDTLLRYVHCLAKTLCDADSSRFPSISAPPPARSMIRPLISGEWDDSKTFVLAISHEWCPQIFETRLLWPFRSRQHVRRFPTGRPTEINIDEEVYYNTNKKWICNPMDRAVTSQTREGGNALFVLEVN